MHDIDTAAIRADLRMRVPKSDHWTQVTVPALCDALDEARKEAIAERDALVRASTVTTEAELNALPEGTVVRDKEVDVLRKDWWGHSDGRGNGSSCRWIAVGDDYYSNVTLPATVLFRPV